MKKTPTTTSNQSRAADSYILPADLTGPLAAATVAVEERAGNLTILQRTHIDIPALLRKRIDAESRLGATEISAAGADAAASRHLAAVESALASSSRQRHAAADAMLSQEPQLISVRAEIDAARADYASGILAEFAERYQHAVEQLQTLWAEGDALGAALRTKPDMPLPVKVSGGPQQGIHPWPAEPLPVTVERIVGDAPAAPKIDPTAAHIGDVLDRLDDAIGFCGGIRETHRREHSIAVRETTRGFDPGGVFVVLKSFTCHLDGMEFEPGMLVNADLLGVMTLHRLVSVKTITLLGSGSRERSERPAAVA